MKPDIYILIEHLQGQVIEISYLMVAAARNLADELGCSSVAVLLGHQQQGLANDLAVNRVLYYDHPSLSDYAPGTYQKVLSALIQDNQPCLVLMGDTSTGVEIADFLSMKLDLPLVSSCRSIQSCAGGFEFTSQVYGGKMLVQSETQSPTTLVTFVPGSQKSDQGKSSQPPVLVWGDVPVQDKPALKLRQMLPPVHEDVDISKEDILISVGRGIENQDNLEMVQELADCLGGIVCASRPIIDQGWLPTSRLVGKSGKKVQPRLYLALGISGAPEHVEAITNSKLIVAINTDPTAPIFQFAKYGSTVDLFDLVPALSESIKHAKAMA